MLEKISTSDQFNQLLNEESKFFVLKHSLTCPISHEAYKQFEKFTGEHPNVPAYYLAVQEARPLSNEIADIFQIKHESPQALLFSSGKAIWNASHWSITNRSLTDAWSEA
ncbi:bacillithiol system redox-active protein YtxJ [Bacillus rubiinfantis]|uniref:bacillithiol system redox-active protein YtxJ n=1 Tax=Bacillus rubiinfantis TaxID=1499680 RepID=UPI0005AB8E2E|nr:bacillithiol system redox-active protein YtxJ [Bacillus rubiinfantis]